MLVAPVASSWDALTTAISPLTATLLPKKSLAWASEAVSFFTSLNDAASVVSGNASANAIGSSTEPTNLPMGRKGQFAMSKATPVPEGHESPNGGVFLRLCYEEITPHQSRIKYMRHFEVVKTRWCLQL